jgi:hypothetical protein
LRSILGLVRPHGHFCGSLQPIQHFCEYGSHFESNQRGTVACTAL